MGKLNSEYEKMMRELDRRAEAKVRAQREAAIRRGQEPADEQQKKFLKEELGMEATPGMTKAEAEGIIYDELKRQGLDA